MVNLQKWLVSSSLPLWALHGVDRKNGGFFEKLDRNLTPSNDCRRARLVARQIYFFASGGSLGWHGPSEYLVNHGYNYLISYLIGPDGKVRATCNSEGQIIDSRQHLYDLAFVLTALATAVIARKDDASAAHQAALTKVAGWGSCSGGGGLIHTTSG
jgi:mannose/cellobiose epimerase-like protein (N-acyl-D-glucosamine 2-epimerase family)